MIDIKDVSKEYVKNRKVIDKFNLEIKDGEIFGLLGPNGAGKTTMLKMITGILKMDKGDILIEENSITKKPIEAKKNFTFITENPDVFLKLKGIEYLKFMGDIYGIDSKTRKEKIEKLARKFDIYDNLKDRIQNYSHGMKQKLLIVGMLMCNNKNWILDEPMTGLDPKSSFFLKQEMREHANNGGTVLFSTHILDVAERLCDRIGIINEGKLIFVGSYQEIKDTLKENKSLEELFLEITNEI